MNLTPDQLGKLEALELRRACFHEVGHAIVVTKLGGVGRAEVFRNQNANRDADGERAWRGRFMMFVRPGSTSPAPDNWRCLVGLAGLVAESMDGGDRDADAIACCVDEALQAGEVSATDAALIGEQWQVSDVAEVVRLLAESWDEVEFEAEGLEKSANE